MKTRKIMALLLMLTMITSALFMGGNASAAKKKPTYKAGTTYRVRYTAQKEGSLTAYMSGRNLYVQYGSKKAVKLTDVDEDDYVNDNRTIAFFTDGARVFYSVGNSDICVYTAKTGKKKHLAENCGELHGGNKYGVVSKNGNDLIYTDINGISETIGKAKAVSAFFNGKLYYTTSKGKTEYTVNTKKAVAFKGESLVSSKNYLYYINSASKLVRMDKKGNKVSIDTNVKQIMGANNGKTVIYNKLDKNGYHLFRATGKKVYRLIDESVLCKNLLKIQETKKLDEKYAEKNSDRLTESMGKNAVVAGDYICFTVKGMDHKGSIILKVNKNGGNAKYVRNVHYQSDEMSDISTLGVIGKTLYYGGKIDPETTACRFGKVTVK